MSTVERDEQVKTVLLDAAKLVEQGWCQGEATAVLDDRRCYCLVGAINMAVGDSPVWQDVTSALRRQIGLPESPRAPLAAWNDSPERTQAEVVAALRGAAEGVGKERAE